GNMVSENLQNAVLQQQNKKLDSEKNLHQKLNKNDLVSKSQQLLNGEIVNVLNQQSDLNANLMTPVQAQQSSAEALVQATTSPLNQIIAELGKPQLNPLQDNAIQTISELNSKISDINSITSKSNKSTLGSIKLNMEDADFFINLTQTQVNDALQANITINAQNQVTLTEAKAQAVQSSAAVSQALIDKLQESMNTNKSFRVDFYNDIAVIMRVDSKGVLSANFLPGSSAVEQYLRNNLAELRQSFENKGLEYNELSYSSKKQNQQKQQRQQKGGQNE
ncbi:flagellar hook-length control protein FliK, partial [bacterium]|nr:flagellar hook-length control protein FliK [bacterium]